MMELSSWVGILINKARPGHFQILLPVSRHKNYLENVTIPLFDSVEYIFLDSKSKLNRI